MYWENWSVTTGVDGVDVSKWASKSCCNVVASCGDKLDWESSSGSEFNISVKSCSSDKWGVVDTG